MENPLINFTPYLQDIEKIQTDSKNDEEMIGNILEYVKKIYLKDDDFIFKNFMDIVDAIYKKVKETNQLADKIWQIGLLISNSFFVNSSELIFMAIDREIELFQYVGREKYYSNKRNRNKTKNVLTIVKPKKRKKEPSILNNALAAEGENNERNN